MDKSCTHAIFLRQIDVFTIEAVSLGALKTCVVSHDGHGPGEGWKCDDISIKESADAERRFLFHCNKSVT